MEETIDLRKLIDIVLKGKIIILISTITCLLIAGIVSWFVMETKYESKAIVQVVNNVQDTGAYSNFVSAEFAPNTYAQRIQNKTIMTEALKEAGVTSKYNERNLAAAVDISPDSFKNYVTLSYKSTSPEDAQHQLEVLMNATKRTMEEAVKQPLMELEKSYNGQIQKLTKEIESIIEEYNQIIREDNLPKILIMQTIINSDIAIEISADQLSVLSNIDGAKQNQLLQMQAQIATKSGEYRTILANYQSIESGIENFNPDLFIRIIAKPTLAEDPASPNNAINLAIGLIMGVMIGLGIVLFRYYWKNSQPTKLK